MSLAQRSYMALSHDHNKYSDGITDARRRKRETEHRSIVAPSIFLKETNPNLAANSVRSFSCMSSISFDLNDIYTLVFLEWQKIR